MRIAADRFDHAVLSPAAPRERVLLEAERAAAAGVRGLCVLPYRVRVARETVRDRSVLVVAVVGFPAAGSRAEILVAEARRAVEDGADELDLVLPMGRLADGEDRAVAEDVHAIRTAAGAPPTKLIVEASELDDARIAAIVRDVVVPTGAGFLKTGTGVYGRALEPSRIETIRSLLPAGIALKVAGGIRDAGAAAAALAAGADVLGASRTFAILEEAGIVRGRGEDDDFQG